VQTQGIHKKKASRGMLFLSYFPQLSLLLLTTTKSTTTLRTLTFFLDTAFVLACLLYFVVPKPVIQVYPELPAFPSAICFYKLPGSIVCSGPMECIKHICD